MTEDMERIWRMWDQTRENGPSSPASGFFRGSVAGADPKRRARPCAACDGFACLSCEWTGIEREKEAKR